jgi:hypothetical protein
MARARLMGGARMGLRIQGRMETAMRTTLLWTLCVGCLCCASARGQEPAGESAAESYEGGWTRRSPSASELIHERAAFSAKQRTARMEARKWIGVSTARPFVHDSLHRAAFPYAGLPWWYSSGASDVHVLIP